MSEKILCVDDDLNILSGFQRNLRGKFQITGALGGEQALRTLTEQGPFAVVVSDLQMPGIGGFDFLSQVRSISPESVRIIFSGRANLDSAIAAVNDGNIFRFLTKPCAPEVLARTLSQGLDQHRLIVAERDLLEKTLRGSVQVLVDILALLNPPVFSRSNRIREYALHIANTLNCQAWKWQIELAAMLSQLGCIAIRETIVSKSLSEAPLTPEEQAEYRSHPIAGARLIGNIPRLEAIARIISLQLEPFGLFQSSGAPSLEPSPELVAFGAQALHAAIDFDKLRSRSLDCRSSIDLMRQKSGEYNADMLAALLNFESEAGPMHRTQVLVRELKPKMITLTDIVDSEGVLLLARDLEISGAVLEVLRRFGQVRGVREPLDVLAPIAR